MRITAVEPMVLEQRLKPAECFSYSQNRYSSRSVLICRVTTDKGIVGWGESFGPAHIHWATIKHYYGPRMVGRNPLESAVIWEELYDLLRDHGQKGLAVEAISAIDIALWDIKGQAFGVPLYQLLGGRFRDHVLPYATGLYQRDNKDIGALQREAAEYVRRGFRGVKLKIGFGHDYDTRAVEAVRATIGPETRLMVDANHAYNAHQAITLGRMIGQHDITWFEEPVPPEDLRGYREVKQAGLPMAIAGGETESTRYDMNRWLEGRAVDVLQPDLGVVGGVSEFQRIATLAHTHNIQCYPHVWGSAITLHAALHCALNLPHFPASLTPHELLFEYDQSTNVFRDRLSKTMPMFQDGIMTCSDAPGLGVVVDEDIIERYGKKHP